MCGIAGYFTLHADHNDQAEESVRSMLSLQRHRGPDGDGIYSARGVVLGHLRLAIIDLSDLGRQPMSNETGDVWVTYNGEIYNFQELLAELRLAGHTFRSRCDTEVLLHGYEQWGIDGLVRRLRGMFAFALYDGRGGAENHALLLVRDRLGIKPLYYAQNNGATWFASEVNALRKIVTQNIDQNALIGFLALGSVPAPLTILKDVQCLPPGRLLRVSAAGTQMEQYWDLCYDEADNLSSLEEMVSDTVQRHLMSDVPLGIFLSGGLDSAGLAAIASRLHDQRVVTLTIAFQEQQFSEAVAARAFSEQFGTEHREIVVTGDEFVSELPNVLDAMDQPTIDGVNTYFVSRAARQAGLKVVLSGLGGDEVFFGYQHYHRLSAARGLVDGYGALPPFLRNVLANTAVAYGSMGASDRWQRFSYLKQRSLSDGLYMLVRGIFAPKQVSRLLGFDQKRVDEALEQTFTSLQPKSPMNGHLDVNRISYLEMKRYLHDQLLRDSDVFSMAHSIELRVPYLDHILLERLCRMSVEAKLSKSVNKPKLLEAINHPALYESAARPKQGFTFPFSKWMRDHAGLMEEQALAHGLLDSHVVKTCWHDFRVGRVHWSRAWATISIGAAARN